MTQYQLTFIFTADSDTEARSDVQRIYSLSHRHVPQLEIAGLAAATWRGVDLEEPIELEEVMLRSGNSERASDDN